MDKSAEEAQQLIKKMAANSYQWTRKRGHIKGTTSLLEIDTLNVLTTNLDALSKKIDRQAAVSQTSQVSVSSFNLCGANHNTDMCFNNEQE